MDETILVIDRKLFDDIGSFQGFNPKPDAYLNAVGDRKNWQFKAKSAMEQDPSYKQPIPYVIIVREPGDPDRVQIFSYTRAKASGEERLHDLLSVGLGGHIGTQDQEPNPGDQDRGILHNALFREITEEVGQIPEAWSMDCVGVINDDETPVGRVHLGFCFILKVSTKLTAIDPDELQEASFLKRYQVKENLDKDLYEPWSKIALTHLFESGQL